MKRTLPPSAEIEEQIDGLLAVGVGENPRESLSELAKLGARLIIQRAVEDEFDAWLGRARYERRPDYQRGLRNFDSGLRNGYRPRRVQTAEGELEVEIPQVREAAEPFVSALFPHSTKLLRTRPLEAMVVGAFVRGLSMRDVESLCEEAGLGKLSKSTASRICKELRERFEQFKRRDLYGVRLVALFLDAIFLNVRPKGPKEGVLCAWGFTEEGERVLVGICLGMRESHEDWLCLARGPDRPRARGADARRRRRRPRPDQGGRAVLASLRPPALLRPPGAQPDREAARARPRARAPRLLAGARRGQGRARRKGATQLPGRGARKSRLCVRGEMPRRTTSTRSSSTCATRCGTANAGARPTCSSARSAKVKRRTKVIGRFPGEESCLSLVWAVLDLQINNACNGVTLSDIDRQKLYRLRHEPDESEEVVAA